MLFCFTDNQECYSNAFVTELLDELSQKLSAFWKLAFTYSGSDSSLDRQESVGVSPNMRSSQLFSKWW